MAAVAKKPWVGRQVFILFNSAMYYRFMLDSQNPEQGESNLGQVPENLYRYSEEGYSHGWSSD